MCKTRYRYLDIFNMTVHVVGTKWDAMKFKNIYFERTNGPRRIADLKMNH